MVEKRLYPRIMEYLLNLFMPIWKTDKKLNKVAVYNEGEMQTFLGMDEVPALIIQPNLVGKRTGPFNMTETLLFPIKLLLIFKSFKTNYVRLDPTQSSMYEIWDKIIALILDNKKLGGITNGLEIQTMESEGALAYESGGSVIRTYNTIETDLNYLFYLEWLGDTLCQKFQNIQFTEVI